MFNFCHNPEFRDKFEVLSDTGFRISIYEEKCRSQQIQSPDAATLFVHGLQGHYELEWGGVISPSRGTGQDEIVFDDPRCFAQSTLKQFPNVSVYGIDLQGHGASEGVRRTSVIHFDDFCMDVMKAMEFISNNEGKLLKIILVGISLGGAVVARTVELIGHQRVHQDKFDLAGAVLLCPALNINQLKQKPVNALLLPVSNFLSWIVPNARLAVIEQHPYYTVFARHMVQDPKCGSGRIPVRLAVEGMNACATIASDVESIGMHRSKFHISIIHAEEDGFVDFQGSRDFFERIPSNNVIKAFHPLDSATKLWHVLSLEHGGREYVLPRIYELIEDVLSA